MSQDNTFRGRALTALAGLCAILVLVVCGQALVRISPPRHVVFTDVDKRPLGSGVFCAGPDFMDDDGVVYTTCGAYDGSGASLFVRFVPASMTGEVLTRFEGRDWDLRIARPCGDGRLFVLDRPSSAAGDGARQVATVRVEQGRATHAIVALPPAPAIRRTWSVWGAHCRGEAAELFVDTSTNASETTYAVFRVEGAGSTRVWDGRNEAHGDLLLGAWVEQETWKVAVFRGDRVLTGRPGDLSPVGSAVQHGPVLIPLGGPGGWLSRGWQVYHRLDANGLSQLEGAGGDVETVIVRAGDALPILGRAGTEGSNRIAWTGLDGGALSLEGGSSALVASRGAQSKTVATDYGTSVRGARALPLPDGRTVFWKNDGNAALTLGPDLERLDTVGPIARIAQALSRERAFASGSFLIVLGSSALWLALVLARLIRDRRLPNLPRASLAYLAALGVGAYGFLQIVPRL